MSTTLDKLKIGKKCIISRVNGEGKIRRRLFDMGVTPGAKVEMIKKAPLGDPLEISIREYELTLRKDEAQLIEITISEVI